MPLLTSAARGRTVCAPTESMPSAKDRISSGKGIPRRFAAPPLTMRALAGGLSFGLRAAFQENTLIRPLRGHLPPWRGKACGRPHGAAPTAEDSLGRLARQTQAQTWNRTKNKFCKLRAQWPGGKLDTHSNFTRRKRCTPSQECVPRNGVRGKRPMDLGGAKRSRSPSDAPPGAFCLLCPWRQSRQNAPGDGSRGAPFRCS